MADKRYQVFISSTYVDLKAERRLVFEELMQMGCIPSGMELFPAADEAQFEFIKKVIDDCDYYVVIIAGRYGSLAADGTSYTQKEYEYARDQGKYVIGLLRRNVGAIAVNKSDTDPQTLQKLASFREEVSKERLIKDWATKKELATVLTNAVRYAIYADPRVGWVRGDQAQTVEMLKDGIELRKRIDELQAALEKAQRANLVHDLAGLDEHFEFLWRKNWQPDKSVPSLAWSEIFTRIAIPMGLVGGEKQIVEAFKRTLTSTTLAELTDDTVQVIKATLLARGLIQQSASNGHNYWHLTKEGGGATVAAEGSEDQKEAKRRLTLGA
jgi:Domain of unknown function (DUF4062)